MHGETVKLTNGINLSVRRFLKFDDFAVSTF